jgi:RNA polymerase sigma factor (TIGR02999 family)
MREKGVSVRPSPEVITSLLERATTGEEQALSELLPVVYQELRQLSRKYMRRESNRQTLQTTALVHEAYLRLLGDRKLQWKNRAHFLAIAARSMRQILVERARARHAQKRGGVQRAVTLEDKMLSQDQQPIDLLVLDKALKALAALDPKQAEVVELRFFAGLTVEEAAEVMGVSPATVKRWWTLSKAWLRREMSS